MATSKNTNSTSKTRTRRTRKAAAPKVQGSASLTVLEGLGEMTATPVKAPKPGRPGSPEWYAKYPHVNPGSVRQATDEDRALLKHCHGTVCTITCVDTGEARVINVQDAFQVQRTEAAQKKYTARRRKERRQARKEARAERAAG